MLYFSLKQLLALESLSSGEQKHGGGGGEEMRRRRNEVFNKT